jgi:flagellar transcriptional activator FlhC
MRNKSILTEARQIERAVTLINLGARLQVLESETDLSYERLLRLYKEVAGKSPSKGQLPFSTDWFMTWQPNIHSSLFLNIHEYLNKVAELDEIDTVIKAFQLYLEQIQSQGLEPQLSVTRAWRLVKFVDNGMLTMTKCKTCSGHFVTHPHEIARHYVCGLCQPPARAGKGRMAGALRAAAEEGAFDASQDTSAAAETEVTPAWAQQLALEADAEAAAVVNEFTEVARATALAAPARLKMTQRRADHAARVS